MIILISGREVLIDEDDLEFCSSLPLGLCRSDRDTLYVHVTSGDLKFKKLARLLMKTPDYLICDHKNGNTLDNRKNNLRNCSQSENAQNKRKWLLKDLPKGVSKSPYGYRARIQINKTTNKFLGTFVTVEEAAEAYNKAASIYFTVTRSETE